MQIEFTKNGVDSSLSGNKKKVFQKNYEINQTCYKRAFFLIIFRKKRNIKVFGQHFIKILLKGVQNLKKLNYLWFILDIGW